MRAQSLTWAEVLEVAHAGSMRQIRAIRKERTDRYSSTKRLDPWGQTIEAVGAEKLVAKTLDVYYADDPALDYGGDVGDYGVRSTEREDGCLLLHPEDPDEKVFVLVVGSIPYQRVAGCILAREGKRLGWWGTKVPGWDPAWWVSQDDLLDVSLLGTANVYASSERIA